MTLQRLLAIAIYRAGSSPLSSYHPAAPLAMVRPTLDAKPIMVILVPLLPITHNVNHGMLTPFPHQLLT